MNLETRVNRLLEGKGDNYIAPFFWQHGEEERVLREYMNKIHEANIGAVCVESRPHPEFAEEGWWRDMDVILDEAKKRSMKVWILDDKHFPTGYAAGAMENAAPELCHQYLDYNVLETWGPRPQMEISVADYAKPQPCPPWMPPSPPPKRVFGDDHLFRVLACRMEEKGKLGDTRDLTPMVEDGKLYFDVPEGYWKIFVIYFTRDARGRNDYINFLDEDSCRILIDKVYEPHYERYKELFGSVIAGFFSDEPPIGNTPGYTRGDLIGNPEMALPWSKEMADAMNREYGPGWESMVPYLWGEGSSGQKTAHIRTAYMNAVSKLVSKCFSDQLGRWCEEHGVEYIGHMLEDCDSSANMGPSMGHFFRGLSGQHMAGIDNIGGQVMPGGMDVHRSEPDMCQDSAGFYHYLIGRMGASMAAVDPKKKGRCLCENFGAYGWRMGVRTEKYLNDHFLARGVNFFVPHAFTPKAFPDPDCPPHFYAHGENPQIRAFGALMAYTNRVCELIDGGVQEAPVALLYHGESQWAGSYESNVFACRTMTQNQISFLVIPADVLADGKDSNTVFKKDEKILSVNGVQCRALVISGCAYLTKAAAEFILEAEKTDFPVVFTGRLPEGISDTDPVDSERLVKALENTKVVKAEELDREFAGTDYRSVLLEKDEPNLTAYRYHYQDGETCLLLNENTGRSISQWITIPRVDRAEIYDPWENKRKAVPVKKTGEGIQVYVELSPLEMLVLLCDLPGTEHTDGQKSAEGEKEHILLENFSVSRCAAREYPDFGGREEADLKHGMGYIHPEFSGFYRYETTVEIKTPFSGAELLIQDAYEAAEVFVNEKSAGLRIAPPYRYDISGLLKEGSNEIAIEVATTLERKAASMGIRDGGMGPKAPLSPAGILGTVEIIGRK